ncbi:iron-containing alcohol dehydrogenase family protein [Eisenibacter elegans]|jgi:3-deoxy-alpha-D-manno-octulosonate 8-oxidase|uniref:iron-containing alcohol dehydrogenase family protein n=1 Tax=Eisenibacter elegans TaxID=997 RepID=UPI0003F787E0|nr:iron-containing alcohol dehydrogenase family protein [Eisenibacter elegans]
MTNTWKNFKSVDKTVFGAGSFNQLDDILAAKRPTPEAPMIFLVDNYFKDKPLAQRVPAHAHDMLLFVDVDDHEPTTEQVDQLRDHILQTKGLPAGVIGIGGGSVMDIAKAVALMLTNEGSSTKYQGLNLIQKPGVYHVGVPTISGTGAEVSMTAVLTGPEKKLGLKCDWTVFDQIVLDPELIADVPRNQWFYTGMDTYIHCVESMNGHYKNTFSEAYGYKSIDLCQDVYLRDGFGQTPINNEKLMVASYMGGLSLTYSEVGVCHALSYGLSFVFGTRHCIANCIIFPHLGDYYPQGVEEFNQMVAKNNIHIPQNLAKDWTDAQIEQMIDVTWALKHMWNHAIGLDWEQKLKREDIRAIYEKM